MRPAVDLLRSEPRARVFFAVLAQSALGTGAAYVALLLVAFERAASPWAISAVLIADLVAPMVLGPLFGAAADRWSRRACAITADVLRAAAFAGIAFVGGVEATVALALIAGAGTALFTPATLAALPSLVREERLPAATSLYGAVGDFGLAVGPALAALLLLAGGPETILLANAATFAVSALVLARLDFGRAPDAGASAGRLPLLREARAGLAAIRATTGLRTVLIGSALALFFGGLVNVAELPFVTTDLDASDAAYSIVVALAGLGIAGGSLAGGRGGPLATLRARYVLGLAVMGTGFVLSGLGPAFGILLATFALAGFGNGLMLVHERLIVQATVPDRLCGRVFGTKDALTAWAFALSFLVAGALMSAVGARAVMVVAGAGVALVAAGAVLTLRRMAVAPASGAREGVREWRRTARDWP
jgi:MFS family permease